MSMADHSGFYNLDGSALEEGIAGIEQLRLRLSGSNLKCHPRAELAYEQSSHYPRQFDAELDRSLLQLMQTQDPLLAVKASGRGKYLFYSGWYWLPYCLAQGLEEVEALMIPEIPVKRLEVAAWSYLLSNLLKAPSRHQVLASLVQVLESIPKAFRSELLGSHSSVLSWTATRMVYL